MRKIFNILKKSGIQWNKIQDGIGQPPWGGFCVEWCRTTAFWVRELEVAGNPLKRSKMQVVIIYGD